MEMSLYWCEVCTLYYTFVIKKDTYGVCCTSANPKSRYTFCNKYKGQNSLPTGLLPWGLMLASYKSSKIKADFDYEVELVYRVKEKDQ